MEKYSHVIEVDSEKKLLKIFRLFENSRREFLTECSIDGIRADTDWEGFRHFAERLGENILIDSPAARDVMRL